MRTAASIILAALLCAGSYRAGYDQNPPAVQGWTVVGYTHWHKGASYRIEYVWPETKKGETFTLNFCKDPHLKSGNDTFFELTLLSRGGCFVPLNVEYLSSSDIWGPAPDLLQNRHETR